jgi:mono/diheme cytochrome c family protein
MICGPRLRIAALLVAFAGSVDAADELFLKPGASSMNGFMAATDATYLKECGACHFAYSPGLLPARSWEAHMARLNSHYGESLNLAADVVSRLRTYLVENAADRSKYAGSEIFMERLDPAKTPLRISEMPHMRTNHRVILEVMKVNTKVKVRSLVNCNGCHQRADEGSFGHEELLIPGLSRPTRYGVPRN